jgi:hypothetical protein
MARRKRRKKTRAEREAAVVAGLDQMRTDNPAGYRRMLRLLARLVARARLDTRKAVH